MSMGTGVKPTSIIDKRILRRIYHTIHSLMFCKDHQFKSAWLEEEGVLRTPDTQVTSQVPGFDHGKGNWVAHTPRNRHHR